MEQQKPKIGMISIGQSPRPDILSIFEECWENRAELIEMGALDGLSDQEVAFMVPEPDDDVLVVKMANGKQHIIGRRHLVPHLQKCADALLEQHVNAMILLCTGSFRPFNNSVPFIIPQKIVNNMIFAMTSPGQVVGILIPTHEQQRQMQRNLEGNHIVPVFASASPHLGEEGIIEAAHQLKDHDTSLIVMHCFGYTQQMRAIVKRITEKPVILANMMVVKVAGELLL